MTSHHTLASLMANPLTKHCSPQHKALGPTQQHLISYLYPKPFPELFLHLQLRPNPGSQQDTCDCQAHELSGVGPAGPSPPLPDHSWRPPATS